MPSRRSSFPPVALKPSVGDPSSADYSIFGTANGGGYIGYQGTRYKIKVLSARFQLSSEAIDVTGETVTAETGAAVKNTVMANVAQTKGRVTFSGHVPHAAGIGLANLHTVDTGAGTTAAHRTNDMDIDFLAGVGRDEATGGAVTTDRLYYKFRLAIDQVLIDWNLDNPFVGVTISGQITKTFEDNSNLGTGTNAPFIETAADV